MYRSLCLSLLLASALLLVLPEASSAQYPLCRLRSNDFLMSRSQGFYNRAVRLRAMDDRKSLQELARYGLITMTRKDAEVYVLEVNRLGRARVRPKGASVILWTSAKAVDCGSKKDKE
jgi:hypothetical protein